MPIVRIREGSFTRPWSQNAVPWRQCEIIDDDSVIIVDMEQAILGGWRYGRVTRQGNAEWCGMKADAILAFKSRDDAARDATEHERASIIAWITQQSTKEE